MAEIGLTVVYEEGEDGWVVVSIPQISGVFSQGRTREEARTNVIDALRLMLLHEPAQRDNERQQEYLHLTIAHERPCSRSVGPDAQDPSYSVPDAPVS